MNNPLLTSLSENCAVGLVWGRGDQIVTGTKKVMAAFVSTPDLVMIATNRTSQASDSCLALEKLETKDAGAHP